MTITIRKTQLGTSYHARIMVGGQRVRATFSTRWEAERWEEETRKAGKIGDPLVNAPEMSFEEAGGRYILGADVGKGQRENYKFALQSLLQSFGDATLSEIRDHDVLKHIAKRKAEGIGSSRLRLEMSFIRLVYNHARQYGIALSSPEIAIKRPRDKPASREDRLNMIVKPNELAAIMEAAEQRGNLRDFLIFLLYTGMRPSEAAGLLWEPARDEKRRIKAELPIGYFDPDRGGFSRIGTKTITRFVPGHPEAMAAVLRQPRDRQWVFVNDGDKRQPYLTYRRQWRTISAQLGLREGLNFYSFRHTARSQMSRCGISTEIAETIIGHQDSSFKFTYIHLEDADLIEAISRLRY
jgi:integrase